MAMTQSLAARLRSVASDFAGPLADMLREAAGVIERQREALQFYARAKHVHLRPECDHDVHEQVHCWPFTGADIMTKCESGERARQALAEDRAEDGKP